MAGNMGMEGMVKRTHVNWSSEPLELTINRCHSLSFYPLYAVYRFV